VAEAVAEAVAVAVAEAEAEPVGSQASARREPTWATVAGALVLGVVLTTAVLAPRESSLVTETTTHTDPATESPCVLTDDDARPVDSVVLEVCGMIRRDNFLEASKRWRQAHDQRVQAGRPVGGDALIIARTAAARGDATRRDRPDAADEADGFARYWAGEAAVKLREEKNKRWTEAKRLREDTDD